MSRFSFGIHRKYGDTVANLFPGFSRLLTTVDGRYLFYIADVNLCQAYNLSFFVHANIECVEIVLRELLAVVASAVTSIGNSG